MRVSLKEGGVYEEEALLGAARDIVERTNAAFRRVQSLCEAAFLANKRDVILPLETSMSKLQNIIESYIEPLFNPLITPGTPGLHGPGATSNSRVAAILRGLQLDEEQGLPPFNPLAPSLIYTGTSRDKWKLHL